MILGIDASNIKTGGGLTHCTEIINKKLFINSGIKKIIIWGNHRTLEKIINDDNIIKKTSFLLNQNFIIRIFWNIFYLKKELTLEKCNGLFVLGGYALIKFKPIITISHNILPFSSKELKNYGLSFQRIKLTILRFFLKNTFNKCDGLIFLSKFAQTEIQKNLNNNNRYAVIPSGINRSFYNENQIIHKKIENYSNENPMRLIYVSTIDMYKHQWNVVSAIYKLRLEGYPIEMNFIGSGSKKALKKFYKSYEKISDSHKFIRYHGEIEYSNLNNYYKKSDLIIFASSCENLPIILLEGMATGLPIVSSNYSPMKDILKNNAEYFDPYNIASISHAIKTSLQNHQERYANSMELINESKKYNWERASEDTFNFISKVMESTK